MFRIIVAVLLVFATSGFTSTFAQGERRSIIDSIPERFFDLYEGELLEVLFQKANNVLDGERVFLLRFKSTHYFAFDSAELDAEALRTTRQLARELVNLDSLQHVLVVGHTDSFGTELYNEQLSKRRALSVINVLSRSGVSSDRLRAVGLGEGYPLQSNETLDGRRANRRVEVFLSATWEGVRKGAEATPQICRSEAEKCDPVEKKKHDVVDKDDRLITEIDTRNGLPTTLKVLRRSIPMETDTRRRLPM